MSTTIYSQTNRQLFVHSPLGGDALTLQHMSGVEELSRPYEYHLTLWSNDNGLDGDQLVGKRITIEYRSEDQRKRFIDGFVSRFGYVGESDQVAVYQATLVPWLWFLDNRSDCRIFQEMTVVDIIKNVFNELGFTDFQMNLSETYNQREYCVQYRETDFNFVSRLMEEEGIFYYFKHQQGKHVMHLCDATSHYYQLEDKDVVCGSTQDQFEHISSWQHVYEFFPSRYMQRDYNFKSPQDKLETKESKSGFENSQKLELFDYPGRYVESNVGDRLTRIRSEEVRAERDVVVGEGDYLSFAPGGKFKMAQHKREKDQGQSFTLIQVGLELNNNLGTGAEGPDYHNYFRCIPAETVFRPRRTTHKPVVEGPQTAVVTTDGQEIVVDEYGRIKVQFPWDRYGQKDFHSSCWIRVSQVHAGLDWGAIDIPRRDEEVIVSFLNGDPDCPIVTGRVYNGDNPVPFDLKGASNNSKHKTFRGLTTKSYEAKGYNEFSMDDTAGEERIYMHAQKDQEVRVRNDSKTRIFGNKHEIVGWEKDGNKGGDERKMIYQDKHLNIKRNRIEKVEGNLMLTVGEGEAEDGGDYDLMIEKTKTEMVGSDSHLIIGGDYSQKVDGTASAAYGGGLQLQAGGDVSCEAGSMGEIHLKAGMKVIIEAGAQLTIKSSGGFVDIGPAGVTIQGTMVKINSGGAAGSGKGCSPKSPADAEPAVPTEPEVAQASNSRMKSRS